MQAIRVPCTTMLRSLAVACATALPWSTLAVAQGAPSQGIEVETENRRYAVEIIIFEYADAVSAGGEEFPPDQEPVEPGYPLADETVGVERLRMQGNDDALEAERPAAEFSDRSPADAPLADMELEEIVLPANIALFVLPPEQLTLQAHYDKLVQLDAYRPVLWTGWSQDTFERDITPEIRLRRLGPAPLSFNGTLQLYLSRFLHLVVDLSRDAPRPVAGNADEVGGRRGLQRDFRAPPSGPVRYHIQEDRIVRSGELRYFDHPKFGLIAKVMRVELPPGDLPNDPAIDSDNSALPAATGQ